MRMTSLIHTDYAIATQWGRAEKPDGRGALGWQRTPQPELSLLLRYLRCLLLNLTGVLSIYAVYASLPISDRDIFVRIDKNLCGIAQRKRPWSSP
jgi:hypothetical protein